MSELLSLDPINGDVEDIIRKGTLFQGLDPESLQTLTRHIMLITLEPNKHLSASDQESIDSNLIIIANGLIIASQYKTGSKEIELRPYGTGDIINVMSILGIKRSVHIQSVEEESTLIIIDLKALEKSPKFNKIKSTMLGNSTKYFSERLNYTEQVLNNLNVVTMETIQQRLQDAKTKLAFGTFVVRTIVVLCVYTLSLQALSAIEHWLGNTEVVSVFLIIATALTILNMMLSIGFSSSDFGLTTRNWKQAIIESLIATPILIAFIFFLKYLFITLDPAYHRLPLIEINTGFNRSFQIISPEQIIIMIVYIIFAPLQEFIIRGGLQVPLYKFLAGSLNVRSWTAIFLSNLIFITFHSHVSLTFALATFIPGLVWGWLYARHKTLIGVSLSHILVGLSVLFFMGVNEIAGA